MVLWFNSMKSLQENSILTVVVLRFSETASSSLRISVEMQNYFFFLNIFTKLQFINFKLENGSWVSWLSDSVESIRTSSQTIESQSAVMETLIVLLYHLILFSSSCTIFNLILKNHHKLSFTQFCFELYCSQSQFWIYLKHSNFFMLLVENPIFYCITNIFLNTSIFLSSCRSPFWVYHNTKEPASPGTSVCTSCH